MRVAAPPGPLAGRRAAPSFCPCFRPVREARICALRAREATARVGWNPYLSNPKLRGRLYRVTVPTVIVWGESDRVVPAEHGRAYLDGIAGSQLTILPECGHAPPFEKPQETAQLLEEFFQA